jgi:NAD-dependent DNA ligase
MDGIIETFRSGPLYFLSLRYPDLFSNPGVFGSPDAYLISTSRRTISHREDVIHAYGTAKLSVTAECFQEIVQKGIRLTDAFHHFYQLSGLCLCGVEVACTGFQTTEIREMDKKVFSLGGKFTSAVTATTTVLIACRMMSPKVQTALNVGYQL